MVSVVCLGIAVLDQVFAVETLPERPAKHFARDLKIIGGGPAATASVAAVRLGAQTRIWARVGADAVGDQIVGELRDYGVDISHLRQLGGIRSTLAAVIVDAQGERMIISFTDPELDPDPSWLPVSVLDEVDAVLADCRWPQGVAEVFRHAREKGLPAILDGDLTPDKAVIELAPLASHVAFSHGGLTQFAGSEDPVEGLRTAGERMDGWVCVTVGDQGCYWLEGGEVRYLPAFRVETVDTVGAGDVFHGALAVALGERRSIEEAVRFASAAAALKCTRFGGRAGIPSRADVDRFLADRS